MRRIVLGLFALMLSSAAAFAACCDGTDSRMQNQQVSIGRLELGMGTATGNSVTINNGSGVITTAALTTAAGATQAVTLTNSNIAVGDIVLAQVDPNGSAGTPVVANVAITAGQAVITLQNIHASAALNSAVKVYFQLIKAGNTN